MIAISAGDAAKITLDSVWIGIGLGIMRTGPAEDASRYLNHLHQMKEIK